jgi:hypothetical protein
MYVLSGKGKHRSKSINLGLSDEPWFEKMKNIFQKAGFEQNKI